MLTNSMQKDIEDILSPPSTERVRKSIPESNSTDAFIEKELQKLDTHGSDMDSILPEAIDKLEDILAIPSKAGVYIAHVNYSTPPPSTRVPES